MGVTLTLPSTASAPLVPGMDTAVAFVVIHLSVVDPPDAIVVESAVNESITGTGGFTVMVMDWLASMVASSPSLAVSV